jgi:hypothetical protein
MIAAPGNAAKSSISVALALEKASGGVFMTTMI